MAGRKKASEGTNKSEFIRNILNENPNASAKDVLDAWEAAGETEKLNPTLYYQVRRTQGLAKRRGGGGRRRKKAARATASATATPTTSAASVGQNGSGADYLSIEKQIDKLVLQAESLGDSKLADELRQARRRVSSKLV